MKTNTLLFLATLTVLATSAHAAQSQPSSELVVLPTYVVSAPRHQPAEQKLNASLDEFRQLAKAPAGIVTALPVLKEQGMTSEALAKAAQDAKSLRVAKL